MNPFKLISGRLMGRRFINLVDKPTVKIRRAADDLQEVFPKIRRLAPEIQKIAAEINNLQSTIKSSKLKKSKLGPVQLLARQKAGQINARLSQFAKLTNQCRELFDREIKDLRSLTLDYLTLVVREYDEIGGTKRNIYRIKVPERDRMRLDAIRAEIVHHLSKIQEHINHTVHEDWLAAKFHERRATSNVVEMMKEVDIQGTIVKLRRIRQLTVEIDHILEELGSKKVSLETLPRIIELFEKELHDIKHLSHHIHVLTRRFHNQIIQIRGRGKETTEKDYRDFLKFARKQAARAYWDTRAPVAVAAKPKTSAKPVISLEERRKMLSKQQKAMQEVAAYQAKRTKQERKKAA